MRRKPNQIGLTLTDYRAALSGYKGTNTWAIWGYNGNVPVKEVMSQFLTYRKQNKQPLKRTRRIGRNTLQNGIVNDCNKVIVKWARKRLLPEARQWLLRRFPHSEAEIRQSEAALSAGVAGGYTAEDIKPGAGPIEYVGKIIAPGHEGLWEKHQAELKKKC